MSPLNLLRWPLLELRASPQGLLALCAAAALWPSIWILSSYGLTTNGALGGGLALYEVAFLASAAGCVLTTVLLTRRAWLLDQLAPAHRPVGVLAVLLPASLAFQVAGTALPAGAMALTGSGGDLFGLAIGALLTALHWSALGLCVFALPASPTLRPVALLTLGWWLPALLATGTGAGGGPGAWSLRLHWILDTARYLRGPRGSVEALGATQGVGLADTAPIAALLLIAASLPVQTRAAR